MDEKKRRALESIYSPLIIKHYEYPNNFAKADHAVVIESLPTCAIKLKIYLETINNVLSRIGFEVQEGTISATASCSIMSQSLGGKTKKEAEVVVNEFVAAVEELHEMASDDEDLAALIAFHRKRPGRKTEILSCWKALQFSFEQHKI